MPVEGHKCIISDFENDGLQKRSTPSIWAENPSIQTKNCVAAIFNNGFYRFVSLVRQPSHVKSDLWKFLQVLPGRTKSTGGQ